MARKSAKVKAVVVPEFVATHTVIPDFSADHIAYLPEKRAVQFSDGKGNTVAVLLSADGVRNWNWHTSGRP